MNAWTAPFHGISHLVKTKDRWVTVQDRENFVILQMWFEGCGFNPAQKIFDNLETAKAYGEDWLCGNE